MRRRDLLAGGALVAAASTARAQSYGQTATPSYPPIDARSVWLIGDGAPPDALAMARRLAALAESEPRVRDTYLAEGAVARLEARFAALLGKADCAFMPTGTLANQIAIRILCGDDRRALVQADSHVYRDESDSVEILSGIRLTPVAPGVTPTADLIESAIEEAASGPFPVRTGAVSLESPVRRLGGRMPSLTTVEQIADACRAKNVRLHLDGARLLLAAPEFDVAAYAACFDTVYVSLYKYLGAPFGAVLAGSAADIAKARELRHVFGGLIHQGWAPALLAHAALDTFPARIAEAHGVAREVFKRLEQSGRVRVRPAPEASNIFQLEMSSEVAAAALARSQPEGVRIGMARDGVVPFYVNETILRRPIQDYVRIFLG